MVHAEESPNKEACLNLCRNFDSCNWFSFDFIGQYCLLFETCQIDEEIPSYVSGQKECSGGKK